MKVVSATSPFAFADRDRSSLRGKGLFLVPLPARPEGSNFGSANFPDPFLSWIELAEL
jgi:hypothetical protein